MAPVVPTSNATSDFQCAVTVFGIIHIYGRITVNTRKVSSQRSNVFSVRALLPLVPRRKGQYFRYHAIPLHQDYYERLRQYLDNTVSYIWQKDQCLL